MPDTSSSLLMRLRERSDADAWEQWVDLYGPLIRAWLARSGLQSADVDDLVQEVLGISLRELPKFQAGERPGAFRAWLRTVTVNCLRMFFRSQRIRPPATGGSDFARILDQLEDPDSGLSRLWDEEHDRHLVQRLLKLIEHDFSPSTWQAFRRTVLDSADADAVAGELRISVNAVLIAKSRVLRRLRQEGKGLIG